jgi:hypothetical protein
MKSFSSRHMYRTLLVTVSIASALDLSAHTQTLIQSSASSSTSPSSLLATTVSQTSTSEQATLLPDAPGIAMLNASASRASANEADPPDHAGPAATKNLTPPASRTQTVIEPGQTAPSLTANDKVVFGLRDSVSVFSVAAWFIAAGYEQVTNGSPNYGTDRGAFGQRLGAAAIRDTSETIFSESVMAPLLHEDPRYYRLGPTHNFFSRAVYAATRAVITRTDSGRTTPNFALIAGNAAGSALTNAYYPSVNQGATQTLETLGTSMGSSALGNVVSEFYDDVFHPHRHQ